MELKVHCDCGQKFKFDVEPVNGQMPFAVACPICQADGTTKANALLQQMSIFKMVEPPPAPIAPITPIAPPPLAPSRMRMNVAAPAAPQMAAAESPPAIAPVSEPSPSSFAGRARLAAAKSADSSAKKPSFGMGLLGGFLGALVGSLIYYLIFKATGMRIGLLAIGVGALAGWLADFLGKGEGSNELGVITAVLVLSGVVGAQYFVALERWHKIVHGFEDAGYTMSVAEAKDVIKAVPTGSDVEIRMYLAKQAVGEGEAAKPADVTDEEVKEFRDKQLPDYRDLASGKETRADYLTKNGLDTAKMKKFQDEEEGTFKGVFLLLLMSKVGIISLIGGAGLAYKLSTNA